MCLKQLSPAWFCEPVHSFCCCCCLLKWNLFAIGRAMSKVQTFQKVNRFLIAILYLPFGWAPSFLGLGAYCCLYLAWRPLIPGNSRYSSCFFPFRYLSSVLSKGDSTHSPFSLLFPTLPLFPPLQSPHTRISIMPWVQHWRNVFFVDITKLFINLLLNADQRLLSA